MTEMHLRRLREQRGWTQQRLAAASGVAVRTIQRLEAGNDASLETLHLLATALDVPVLDLFVADQEPNTTAVAGAEAAPEPKAARPRRRTRAHRPLLRSLTIAVLCAVVCAALGALLGIGRAPVYEASEKVFVGVSAPGTAEDVSATRSRQVAASDALVATSPIVLTKVAQKVSVPVAELQRDVTVSRAPDTVVLTVSARSASPDTAATVADAVVDELIATIGPLTPTAAVVTQHLTRLTSASAPVAPTVSGGTFVGGGIGLITGLALAAVLLLLTSGRRGRGSRSGGAASVAVA